MDWNEVWEVVAKQSDPEPTEEEELMRNEALLSKVMDITAMFGGSPT